MEEQKAPQEAKKVQEDILNAVFELILEKHAIYVTEGNNGIIFKFDLNELSPANVETLIRNGVIENSSVAIKLLKVNKPGAAEREYKMQKIAREIVDGINPSEPRANVPRVYRSNTDIKVPQKHRRPSQNGEEQVEDRAEIIIMDFIEGTDLATMLYKQVITTHENEIAKQAAKLVDKLPFFELQDIVFTVLGYEKAPKKNNENEQLLADRRMETVNIKKLFDYLRRTNYVLDPLILEKVRNTVTHWKKNGFSHNDLHERNVMLGANNEVYIIDFGTAVYNEPRDTSKLDDSSIILSLEQLSSTRATEKSAQTKALDAQISALVKTIGNTKEVQNLLIKIEQEKYSMKQIVASSGIMSMPDEAKIRKFIAIGKIIIEKSFFTKEEFHAELLEIIKSPKTQPLLRNLLTKFIAIFE